MEQNYVTATLCIKIILRIYVAVKCYLQISSVGKVTTQICPQITSGNNSDRIIKLITHTHICLTALFWDHAGEPVPER